VFLVRKGGIEGRFDPNFYKTEFQIIVDAIERFGSEKLSDLIRFSSETWNGKDFFENEFPYIEISEIDILSGKIQHISFIPKNDAPSRAKMIVRNDDIIVSTTRPSRGAISFVKSENNEIQIASTGFSILRNLKNQEILKEYLFYALRQDFSLKQMEQRSSGGNYPAITTEELKKILIPVPPLETQAEIVSLFEAAYAQKRAKEAEADALIAGIDGYLLNALGINLPQSIEKKKFFYTRLSKVSGGRFDPFYHQNEFEELEKALKSGKYNIGKLSIFLSQIHYGASVKNEYAETGIPFLRISDLKRNEIDVKEMMYLPESIRKDLGNAFVYEGDFLISRSGTLGVIAMVTKAINGFAYGSFMIKFRLKQDAPINRDFLSYFLNSETIQKIVARNKIGAIQGNITIPTIKNLQIPLPPLAIQTKIAVHITEIRNQAKKIELEATEIVEQAKARVEKMILGEA